MKLKKSRRNETKRQKKVKETKERKKQSTKGKKETKEMTQTQKDTKKEARKEEIISRRNGARQIVGTKVFIDFRSGRKN